MAKTLAALAFMETLARMHFSPGLQGSRENGGVGAVGALALTDDDLGGNGTEPPPKPSRRRGGFPKKLASRSDGALAAP